MLRSLIPRTWTTKYTHEVLKNIERIKISNKKSDTVNLYRVEFNRVGRLSRSRPVFSFGHKDKGGPKFALRPKMLECGKFLPLTILWTRVDYTPIPSKGLPCNLQSVRCKYARAYYPTKIIRKLVRVDICQLWRWSIVIFVWWNWIMFTYCRINEIYKKKTENDTKVWKSSKYILSKF